MSPQPRMIELSRGPAAIGETIDVMWRMIVRYSPTVRGTAEDIIRAVPDGACVSFRRAAALYAWAQAHLLYVNDHTVVEEIRGAELLLQEIQATGVAMGDCDDYVVLIGALFTAIGLPIEIVEVRPLGQDPGQAPQDHVYLRVETDCGAIAADAIHGEPFGWEIPPEAIVSEQVFPMPSWAEEAVMR